MARDLGGLRGGLRRLRTGARRSSHGFPDITLNPEPFETGPSRTPSTSSHLWGLATLRSECHCFAPHSDPCPRLIAMRKGRGPGTRQGGGQSAKRVDRGLRWDARHSAGGPCIPTRPLQWLLCATGMNFFRCRAPKEGGEGPLEATGKAFIGGFGSGFSCGVAFPDDRNDPQAKPCK